MKFLCPLILGSEKTLWPSLSGNTKYSVTCCMHLECVLHVKNPSSMYEQQPEIKHLNISDNTCLSKTICNEVRISTAHNCISYAALSIYKYDKTKQY